MQEKGEIYFKLFKMIKTKASTPLTSFGTVPVSRVAGKYSNNQDKSTGQPEELCHFDTNPIYSVAMSKSNYFVTSSSVKLFVKVSKWRTKFA